MQAEYPREPAAGAPFLARPGRGFFLLHIQRGALAMPYFDFDPRTIDDQTGWGAPLGASAHGPNRQESGSSAWRKSFTISITMNAFIPRNKGQTVHGMAAVEQDVRKLAWGFEPHQYRLGKRFYMFATDNRSYAGETGSSRVSLSGQFDSMRIGSPGTLGAIFNAPPVESFQLQADVTNSLLGPSYVPDTLLRDKSYPTKRERVQDYSPTHSGLTVGASGAYPFNSRAPSIDFGLSASLRVLADGSVALAVVGGHNAFPAYEVILNGRIIYKSYPTASGPGIWNLRVYPETKTRDLQNPLMLASHVRFAVSRGSGSNRAVACNQNAAKSRC